MLVYNPKASSITVKFTILDTDGSEVTENINLGPTTCAFSPVVPTGSGAFVESTDGTFLALSLTDADVSTTQYNTYGQVHDWGHPLQPLDQLTSQVLVGWGYGCTENDCDGKTERSAVWVSPVADADIYVDYQNTGANYDVFPVNKYQSIMIRDTNDHDMSGCIIFATDKGSGPDGRPVDFASAWGQDPSVSKDVQAISLDLGTTVLPFPTVITKKEVDKDVAYPGDILTYKITVMNVGQSHVAQGAYKIVDELPAMTTFVEGSVRYSTDGGSSYSSLDTSGLDVGSTPFPLDEAGLASQDSLCRRGCTHVVKFQVLVDPDLVQGREVKNIGYVDPPYGGNLDFDATTELVFGPDITVANTVYKGDSGDVGCDGATEIVTDVLDSVVTYCFVVTNVGSTYLDAVTLTNDDLGIVAGDIPIAKLAPGESKLVTFKSKLSASLVNTVVADAKPVYNNGVPIDDYPNVRATDPSQVDLIENEPDILLDNVVYKGQLGTDSCETMGVEHVRGYVNDEITYCFKVTNTGNTHLTNVKVTNSDLSYSNDAMVDLAPGASTVVSLPANLTDALKNVATATGTPSSPDGQPIAGMDDVSNSDPSEVSVVLDTDTRSGTRPERPDSCLQTNWEDAGNSQNLVCRAKEVYFTEWVDPPSLSCQEGELITLSLVAKIHYNTARYDSGWTVATDGGDALRGECSVNGLVSGGYDYKPTPSKSKTEAYVSWNDDAVGGNDECGDLIINGGGGADLVVPFIQEQQIKCVDDNLDGLLDFGVCFSWRVKGTDGFCTLSRDTDGTQGVEADLFPGTPSKCFCSRVDVGTISVIKPNDDLAVSPC